MKKQISITVYIALVFNNEGRILVVKRSEPELAQADEKWELPGGKAEAQESAFQAVTREVFEETGYRIEPLQQIAEPFISEWDYADFHQHTTIYCIISKLLDDAKVEKHDHHVGEIGWVTPEKLMKLEALPGVKEFVRQGVLMVGECYN